jgi:hypothetical protein
MNCSAQAASEGLACTILDSEYGTVQKGQYCEVHRSKCIRSPETAKNREYQVENRTGHVHRAPDVLLDLETMYDALLSCIRSRVACGVREHRDRVT